MSKIKSIENIIKDIKHNNFEMSQHAFERALERNIDIEEIIRCADSFIIIEDYPEDKYSPSCLMLAYISDIPLHIQVTRRKEQILKIITLYKPDISNWTDDYRRRK